MEGQIWSKMVEMVRDPSAIIADLELNYQTGEGHVGEEVQRLRGEVRKLKQEVMRVLGLYRRGKVRIELLDAEMESVAASLKDLRERLDALEQQRINEQNVAAAGERIQDYCLKVSEGLEGLDADGKRALMSRLGVKAKVVKGDLMITVEVDPGFMINENSSGRGWSSHRDCAATGVRPVGRR